LYSRSRSRSSFLLQEILQECIPVLAASLHYRTVMEQVFALRLGREFNLGTGSAQGHIEDVRTGKALHSIQFWNY
jgi:hypothetical protein